MSDSDDDTLDYDYYEDTDVAMQCKDDNNESLSAEFEEAACSCLSTSQVEAMLISASQSLSEQSRLDPQPAQALLYYCHWDPALATRHLEGNEPSGEILQKCGILTKEPLSSQPTSSECPICMGEDVITKALSCGHYFCLKCWQRYLKGRLDEGVAAGVECMDPFCPRLVLPPFARVVLKPSQRSKYHPQPNIFEWYSCGYDRFLFRDYVSSHQHLRQCNSRDCASVFLSQETKPKRAKCEGCQNLSCILCGREYHAPTSCTSIAEWAVKCMDDSETANYMSAHTKDCPACHSPIEKNGGCNHMQCAKCRHHFCWMCFGDWKTHGSEYYECSRYKENSEASAEANNLKARKALEKYLHYFERFENHSRSLKMEEEMQERLRKKIEERVETHDGTWIDWQYLHDASKTLTRCRYTLQYTYPFAYYEPPSGNKELFEYQQSQLEKEVEELAWAVERADYEARGSLHGFMHRAEHRRLTLLQSFLRD